MAWFVNHDTVFGGFLHLCDNNCALLTMALVKFGEFLEGIFADDIGVEDEEWRVILSEDLFGQLQGTGSSKGLCLDGEFDAHVVFLLILTHY